MRLFTTITIVVVITFCMSASFYVAYERYNEREQQFKTELEIQRIKVIDSIKSTMCRCKDVYNVSFDSITGDVIVK